jgi:putative NIF3 family GTP cyclohydrolase 1 type 2
MIKIKEILEHFINQANWVDKNNTVDRIVMGDPEKIVDQCLVTWIPSFKAIRTAVERNVDLIICHEPTFWEHLNDRPENESLSAEKAHFINEHNLTILRNHDCWDKWPDIGIPWAWAKFLGLQSKPIAIDACNVQHRYDIPSVSVNELARKIARRCAVSGESNVQVAGDGSQHVSKIGIGTGCGCSIKTYVELGCDCFIVCDDGSNYCTNIQMAQDLGYAVIRVNHGTSEEPGMITLENYINENIDGLRAQHLPQGCTYKLIGSHS